MVKFNNNKAISQSKTAECPNHHSNQTFPTVAAWLLFNNTNNKKLVLEAQG